MVDLACSARRRHILSSLLFCGFFGYLSASLLVSEIAAVCSVGC